MLVEIMTSSMCTGGFVCAGGEAPCCTHRTLLFLTDSLSLSLSSSPQIDLEPEGKVYVVIDLSGSSTEGKNAATQRLPNEQDATEHTNTHRQEDAGMCWKRVK